VKNPALVGGAAVTAAAEGTRPELKFQASNSKSQTISVQNKSFLG
jgi:hypothetical protein